MRRDRNTSVCPLFVSDGQLKALDTGLRLYHISVYKLCITDVYLCRFFVLYKPQMKIFHDLLSGLLLLGVYS